MKWILLAILVAFSLVSTPVLADTSADVTVTATGWIAGYPEGFTLTYVSDNQIDITWTKGEDAVNTMVRAAFGHVPEDISDGYQVYYGDGESYSDTSLTLAGPEIIYYRAWSQNADGVWAPLFASGDTEEFMSASFLFIGFILIAAFLSWFAYKVRMLIFSMVAAMSWLGLGTWLLLSGSTNLEMSEVWTQIFGFVFIVMTIGILTLSMRTSIRHEAKVRGKLGYPGAETESWQTWGPSKRNRKPTASERQAEYKETLKGKTRRK